jgi:hypothetical protein
MKLSTINIFFVVRNNWRKLLFAWYLKGLGKWPYV